MHEKMVNEYLPIIISVKDILENKDQSCVCHRFSFFISLPVLLEWFLLKRALDIKGVIKCETPKIHNKQIKRKRRQ